MTDDSMTPRGRLSAQPNECQGLRESTQAALKRRLRGFSYPPPGPTLDIHLSSQGSPLKGSLLKTFHKDFLVRQRITFHQDFYVRQQGRGGVDGHSGAHTKTKRSESAKLTREHNPIAMRFAARGSSLSPPTRRNMNNRLPAIDIAPVVALNRSNASAAREARRSAQVHLRCQTKLFSTDNSTATDVANM